MNASVEQAMITERYQRAASFLPQSVVPSLSGLIYGGYWIDDNRFFFCVSELVDGFQRRVPSIANALSGKVEPVLSFEALTAHIEASCGKTVTGTHLITARYEMPNPTSLVVILGLDAYRIDLEDLRTVEPTKLESSPSLRSPDGQHAIFADKYDLSVRNESTRDVTRVTTDGEHCFAYGANPESGIAPISTSENPIPVGMWSQDSQWFITHRIDERHLPLSALVEHAPKSGSRPRLHQFKVAAPDIELPRCEFITYHVKDRKLARCGGTTVSVHIFSPFTLHQCWVTGEQFFFLDINRFSSSVALMAMSLASGEVSTILTETTDSGWIDLHPFVVGQPMVRVLRSTDELIWYSQEDGRGHLYLHALTGGARKNRITEGPWVVRELVHVDEGNRRILFLASGFDEDSDLAHRRLCVVNFDGSGFDTLFQANGDLSIKPEPLIGGDSTSPWRPGYAFAGISPNGRYIAASLGSATTPTQWFLLDIEQHRTTHIARVDIEAKLDAPSPVHFEALAADGKTRLFGAMYFPSDFDTSMSYPLVDYIYPGPQINWYQRRLPGTVGLELQAIAELGMIGIMLETRGMPNHDRAFHQANKGRLLEPQLSDHVAVIEQLSSRHKFLDASRVGIFGQSGGGYATARALFDYPGVFKVGVAVCGNHDNRNYISHWIDKYGGRPGTAERDEQANVTSAHKLQGKLMLMHGDMDENVHLGHTLALSAALIAAGKDFEQLIVAGATHRILWESPYAVQRLWNFLVQHLLNIAPPTDMQIHWKSDGIEAAVSLRMIYND